MKRLFIFAVCAALRASAQDSFTNVVDLGVVTEHWAIVLTKDPGRSKDFKFFRIELASPNMKGTNSIKLFTTNEVLTFTDLAPIPAGPVVMAVTTAHEDGDESPGVVSRFTLERSLPAAPKVRKIGVVRDDFKRPVRKLLDWNRITNALAPPIPSAQPQVARAIRPLGTNEIGGAFLNKVNEVENQGTRRSE